jgi:hypothetical protein
VYGEVVADKLYLSYKLHNPMAQQVVRGFEKLLRAFPYSKLTLGASTLLVQAVREGEPALFEESYEAPLDPEQPLAAVREYAAADVAMSLETWWELWQYEKGEWKLTPSRVTLAAYCPEFDSSREDDLRVDFGLDTHFLPQPDLPNFLFMARSNIRSLLHLVHELDAAFPQAVRTLWTESGDNFAARLQEALTASDSASE